MDIHQLKIQADIYLQQGKFAKAISLYEQRIGLNPDLLDSYLYLGLCWLLIGDEYRANDIWLSIFDNTDFDVLETELTNFTLVLKMQAQAYLSNLKPEIAQRIYEVIIEWDNSNAEVYYHLGHAVSMQGNLELSIAYWETATTLQANWVEPYLQLALTWQKLLNFPSAIACYQQVIKIFPNYLLYYQLGLCYTHIPKWELAIDCFEKSIQLQNDYAPAYSDLGVALIYKGNFNQGVEYLKTAIKLQSKIISWKKQCHLNNQGMTFLQSLTDDAYQTEDIYWCFSQLIEVSKLEIYQDLLHKIIEINPEYTNASLALSKLLLKDNQPTAAIEILNKITNHPEVDHLLGQCWLQLKDYQKAIVYLTNYITSNPQLTDAHYLLGIAHFQAGDIDQAIATLKKSVALDSKSPLNLAYLGFLLANQQQFAAANQYFQQAININSSVSEFIDDLINALPENTQLNYQLENSHIQIVDPPREFYESTAKWIENDAPSQATYHQIYPEIDIDLNYPQSLDNFLHFSFRFEKTIKLPASFVVRIPQGRFWLSTDQTQSLVMTDQSHFLADISPDYPILSPQHPDKYPSNHAVFAIKKLPPIQTIDGKVAVLAGLSNHVYFHWMLDVLPRLELLKLDLQLSEIDYFIVDNRLPFQQETLTKLQIPEEKQLQISSLHHLQATELIIPSFPGCVAWMPKWTCDFLKQNFLKAENHQLISPLKKIYITRKLAKSRRIINEDELLALLQPYGFQSVILESMSVAEQAALFAQAEMIISPHGSGLTNLVFCQPGTKVIELFSPNYVYHCYWWISNLVGLDYYYLIGETLSGWHLQHLIYPQSFAEDIMININAVSKILQIIGGDR
jgi:tetratricopeptide (TPR) repeat protein